MFSKVRVLAPGFVCLGVAICAMFTAPEAHAAVTAHSIEGHGASVEHRLAKEKQRRLLQSLWRITGDSHLRFDANGRLLLGAEAAETGSSTAIGILRQAVNANAFFIIEDHSDSNAIHFGQIDEGLIYENEQSKARFTIWRVRLDFDDFEKMEASPEVRASFDIGFTLLHELLHGLGLKDTEKIGELGGCEKIVNQMRAELGLAERERYHGEPVQIAPGLLSVRLRFRSAGRRRPHYLFFLIRSGPRWGIDPAPDAPCDAIAP
ncbi:MAG: hypothetical protein SF339_04140 [Blastocatellia bacterium]|nr:hypothetical protein [Blastocatellia bacterium]